MSINIHEAIKAIRDMRPIIDPEEDYLTIVAAEESIATSEAKRRKQLEEAHANLKGHWKPPECLQRDPHPFHRLTLTLLF